MARADLARQICTIARAVSLVGDEWTFMILREMFLGHRRFDEFLRHTGASAALLSQRLKKLEAEGVIRKEAYSERPVRYEYRLTAMGRELWPAVIALKQWGDKWLGDGPAPVEIVHKTCGHVTEPQMTCSHCGEPMAAHDAEPRLSEPFQTERHATRKQS